MDIEKKKLELNNVLAEKNIRLLQKNGAGEYKWTYVHDVDKAAEITGEIASLEEEMAEKRLQTQENADIYQMNMRTQGLKDEQTLIKQQIEKNNESFEKFRQAIEDQITPLQTFAEVIRQINGLGKAIGVNADASSLPYVGENYKPVDAPKGGSSGKKREYTGGEYDIIEGMKSRSALWHDADEQTRKKLNELNKKSAAAIGATYNDAEGAYYKDGKRLYDNGGIASGKGIMLKGTDADELVLSPKQTVAFPKILENLEDVTDSLVQNMLTIRTPSLYPDISAVRTASSTQYSFNGDIVLKDVQNPKQFMDALNDGLRHNKFK